jgi:hypothetical protein
VAEKSEASANVQGHPVNKVVDKKSIFGKRTANEEERHKGSLTQKTQKSRA